MDKRNRRNSFVREEYSSVNGIKLYLFIAYTSSATESNGERRKTYRNSACVPETCFPSSFSSTCVFSSTPGLVETGCGIDRAWYQRRGTRTAAEEARTPMWKPIVSARQPARMRAAETGAVDEPVLVLVKDWLDSVGCGASGRGSVS